FIEPRLLFVERRERAQRTFVRGLLEQDLFHRASRAARHARGAKVEPELVHRALAELAPIALAHRQRLVYADRALVFAAAAEQRAEREVRLDVLDVFLDDVAQLADDRVVVARDQVAERAHVRAAVLRGAPELAVVGDVVAADEHTGGHRAEADQE